jgi:hypothetical protein
MPALDLLFRSCARVYSVHGAARPVEGAKGEILLTCLASLLASAKAARHEGPLRLTVLDDHSDAEVLEQVRRLLSQAPFEARLRTIEGTGNGASIEACFRYAKAECPGLIYFVEDDYLHCREAIGALVAAHAECSAGVGREVALFPCDHPDRYRAIYPSSIVFAAGRHWRTVQHTTGTHFISRATLEKHWPLYLRFARYGIDPEVNEDNSINRVYLETPCFSPIPTLAVHLESNGLSPGVDWKAWWQEARREARGE